MPALQDIAMKVYQIMLKKGYTGKVPDLAPTRKKCDLYSKWHSVD